MFEVFVSIILATAGQILLSRHDLRGLVPVALAVLILLIALWQDGRKKKVSNEQTSATSIGEAHTVTADEMRYRQIPKLSLFGLAFFSAIIAFAAAHDNTFRWYGAVAWILALVLFLIAFWERDRDRALGEKTDLGRDGWRLSWMTLAAIGLILIGFWFRFWRLDQMPSEMTSDHIEKLLDAHDLVSGQRPIFFVRNTGREPWQFYWTLMLIRLFDLDTKFFALKLGTALIGLVTLPGVYLLGRDLFGRWVALWATLFTAVASWPVILSRVGLRFPFAPAATAWSLFYLLRGLRDGRRNDFLLLGLWLGVGLQGYTAFRAMPLAVMVCWGLALVFRPSSLTLRRSTLVRNALLTILIAVIVFIPLGRFSLDHPDDFWRRSVSRMADPNQPTPDGPLVTLGRNLADLALVFHWQGDNVWVNTIANAPILDPLLGGLLVLGLVIVLWRGLRLHDPFPLLLLIAGLILLLPSALSLAYPVENPSVVRAGGAIPAVMVIAALPLSLAIERGSSSAGAVQGWDRRGTGDWRPLTKKDWRPVLLIAGTLAVAAAVIAINYRRYFVDYWKQYEQNALNTTEIASAIRGFIESGGNPANAWIIAWPYWIDTRGVGIELGDPPWNNVILEPEELDSHVDASLEKGNPAAPEERPRFYVLHPNDRKNLERLRALFPDGWSQIYTSERPGRSFILFYVPRAPSQGMIQKWRGVVAYAP